MNTTFRTALSVALLATFAGLATPQPASAQNVPGLLNYQGVLRQGDGTPAPAGYKDIEFRIYNTATGGTLLWARSHRVNLDTNGLFNVVLMEGGSPITAGNPVNQDLLPVFTSADSQDRFIELTVAGSTPIMPRQRFVTTAFAFLAADVAQATQNFTVQGALTVKQSARVQTLTVDQNTTVGGSVTVSTNLTVNQNATIGGSLTVTNDLTVNQRATVGGDLTANQRATVGTDLTVNRTATVQGLTTLNDALVLGGHASVPARALGILAGGYASPDSGRVFIGDGTGWKFHFSKQVGGTNTDLVTIKDDGGVAVKGGPPFVFKTFKPPVWTWLDTGYATNEWSAAVVGSKSYGDFNEDDSGYLIHMRMVPGNNGTWWIDYGIRYDDISDIWVDVLFIRHEWVLEGRSW